MAVGLFAQTRCQLKKKTVMLRKGLDIFLIHISNAYIDFFAIESTIGS